MIFFTKIPPKHRYRRYLEFINRELLKMNILPIFFMILSWIPLIVLNIIRPHYSPIQNHALNHSLQLVHRLIGFANFIHFIFPDTFSFLKNLGIVLVIILIIYLLFKLGRSFSKKASFDLLDFWCKMLIDKQLITMILDPLLLMNYQSRSKSKIIPINIFNLNIVNMQKKKNTRFVDYLLYNMSLSLIPKFIQQYPEVLNNKYIKTMKTIETLLLGFLLLIIICPLSLAFWGFSSISHGSSSSLLTSIIFSPIFIFLLIYISFGTMMARYAIIASANNMAMMSIIRIMLWRDPENDYQMVNYRWTAPSLTYEKVVLIIESYLYSKQGSGDMVNPTLLKVKS